MPKKTQNENNDNFMIWAGAGFAIGFACGYLTLESAVSGLILGIGLGVAMGLAGKSYAKKGQQ